MVKRFGIFLLAFLLLSGSLSTWDAVARQKQEPPGSIPFELVGMHTFIEISLAGEKLSFVFDTGAAGMVIDARTARRLDMATRSGGTATGAVGSQEVRIASGLTLEVGPLHLKHLSAVVLPLDHLGESRVQSTRSSTC